MQIRLNVAPQPPNVAVYGQLMMAKIRKAQQKLNLPWMTAL